MNPIQLRHHQQMMTALAQAGVITAEQARGDSGESLFIEQELQAIEAAFYETPFGQLKSADFIPMDDSVPPGAQEWGYDRVTGFGIAQWMSADGKDFPWSGVDRSRATFPLKTMAAGYRYTVEDLEAAQFSGRPLEPYLAKSARRMIDAFKDKIFLEGDTSVGFDGFINSAAVSQVASANGLWDGSAATPDQIITQINQLVYQLVANTHEILPPTDLIVPPAVYGNMTTTARSANSDTTIWEFIQRNNPYLKRLSMLQQLSPNADTGGVMGGANTGRAILYRKDPEVVVAKTAIAFDQRPPQWQGLTIEVPCRAKIGGTHWRAPVAATYITGVR